MRTTVIVDPDVHAAVVKMTRDRQLSSKDTFNQPILSGLAATPSNEPSRTQAFSMGEPVVPLDKALTVAAELEDEDLVHRPAI